MNCTTRCLKNEAESIEKGNLTSTVFVPRLEPSCLSNFDVCSWNVAKLLSWSMRRDHTLVASSAVVRDRMGG